jgi:transcriptional regulator with XRE-family HTH domain
VFFLRIFSFCEQVLKSLTNGDIILLGMVGVMSIFAKRLKKLREEKGLSQRELAKQVNIAHSTLGMYEIGEREPDFKITSRLASYLNTSVDYLVGLTDDPHPVDDIKKAKVPDLDAPLRQKSLAEAFYKISEMSWEFDLDTETMHMLIDKAVAKFGPPPHMEKGGIAAHGPSVPGTGIFDKEDDSD